MKSEELVRDVCVSLGDPDMKRKKEVEEVLEAFAFLVCEENDPDCEYSNLASAALEKLARMNNK